MPPPPAGGTLTAETDPFLAAQTGTPGATDIIGESRAQRRMPLQLKTALVYHQHEDAATRPTFHGTSHDISMHGLTLIVEKNIFTHKEVTVLIALPPTRVGADKKIIEATARMVYTVYTGQYMAFRVGLAFRQFKRDGESRLRAALADAGRTADG